MLLSQKKQKSKIRNNKIKRVRFEKSEKTNKRI